MMTMTLQQVLQAGLALGCIALAAWCGVLARRLRRLNDLETGLGGAIAVMTSEVGRLEAALAQTRIEATTAGTQLAAAVENARKERAMWAIQSRLVGDPNPRPRRRRREAATPEDPDATS